MAPRYDEDGLDSSPWYIKAFVRLGAPTAFASILLWFLISNVTGTLSSILATEQALMKLSTDIITNQNRILIMLDELHDQHEAFLSVTQAMCYNAATTETGRQRCYGGQ